MDHVRSKWRRDQTGVHVGLHGEVARRLVEEKVGVTVGIVYILTENQ